MKMPMKKNIRPAYMKNWQYAEQMSIFAITATRTLPTPTHRYHNACTAAFIDCGASEYANSNPAMEKRTSASERRKY